MRQEQQISSKNAQPDLQQDTNAGLDDQRGPALTLPALLGLAEFPCLLANGGLSAGADEG